MNTFYLGSTVVFSLTIMRASNSILFDPDSVTITISNNTVVVNDQAMTKDSVGEYHYDWTPSEVGIYTVEYKATNVSRVSVGKDQVSIVP